jgi:hypothetical protein
MTLPDYVYYILYEEELLEKVFPNESEAHEYAEQHELKDYEIVEWDVS